MYEDEEWHGQRRYEEWKQKERRFAIIVVVLAVLIAVFAVSHKNPSAPPDEDCTYTYYLDCG